MYLTDDKKLFNSFTVLPLTSEETGLKRTVYIGGTGEGIPIPKQKHYIKYGNTVENSVNIWFLPNGNFHVDSEEMSRKHIGKQELLKVIKWIVKNFDLLYKVYYGIYDHGDFSQLQRSINSFVSLNMPSLYSARTGLKKPVWLDISASIRNISHNSLRIKYGFHQELTFTFYDTENINIIGQSNEIPQKEIDMVKSWILLNCNLLVQLYNGTIDWNTFLNQCQKL